MRVRGHEGKRYSSTFVLLHLSSLTPSYLPTLIPCHLSRKFLETESLGWVADGLISEVQRQQLLARYPPEAQALRLLPLLGSVLVGLSGLSVVAEGVQIAVAKVTNVADGSAADSRLAAPGQALQSDASMRIYSVAEQDHLGAECLGFVSFLETSGVLPAPLREIVMDRAMASPGEPLALDDLKIIVLMVYWRFGQEPDALVLDELCDDASDRVAH